MWRSPHCFQDAVNQDKPPSPAPLKVAEICLLGALLSGHCARLISTRRPGSGFAIFSSDGNWQLPQSTTGAELHVVRFRQLQNARAELVWSVAARRGAPKRRSQKPAFRCTWCWSIGRCLRAGSPSLAVGLLLHGHRARLTNTNWLARLRHLVIPRKDCKSLKHVYSCVRELGDTALVPRADGAVELLPRAGESSRRRSGRYIWQNLVVIESYHRVDCYL